MIPPDIPLFSHHAIPVETAYILLAKSLILLFNSNPSGAVIYPLYSFPAEAVGRCRHLCVSARGGHINHTCLCIFRSRNETDRIQKYAAGKLMLRICCALPQKEGAVSLRKSFVK